MAMSNELVFQIIAFSLTQIISIVILYVKLREDIQESKHNDKSHAKAIEKVEERVSDLERKFYDFKILNLKT